MRRNHQSGFSLLELLLSMTILSMIAVAFTSLLGTGTQVWNVSARMDTLVEEGLGRNRLRTALENMPLPSGHIPASELLQGDRSAFWIIVSGPTIGHQDHRRFKLEIKQDGDAVVVATLVEAETIEQQTIADGVEEFAISYFGAVSSQENADWHDAWLRPETLPKLVKIQFHTQGRFQPPLVIQPGKISRQRLISRSSLVPPT